MIRLPRSSAALELRTVIVRRALHRHQPTGMPDFNGIVCEAESGEKQDFDRDVDMCGDCQMIAACLEFNAMLTDRRALI